MQIKKDLCQELLKAAYMQRWNDKLRPVELIELDKQAHKMIIAYFLGKHHEQEPGFSWPAIITGGMFELLQRIVVTDIKPQIFEYIRRDEHKYADLNRWVYTTLEPIIDPLGHEFCQAFKAYFRSPAVDINRRILNAAHFYATHWEFSIIARENPSDYEIEAIKQNIQAKLQVHNQLPSMRLLSDNIRYQNFISLCGQLRFQIRWSRIHRVPRTSVLGHMLFVAIVSYLFSLQMGADETRQVNNYFTGLFHDLPEALTRDIISPVKRSIAGLDEMIKGYEHQEMQKVYALLPDAPDLRSELKRFTEHEFEDLRVDGRLVRDGQVVAAADKFAAFLEAHEAIRNGSPSQELRDAMAGIRAVYAAHPLATSLGLTELYDEFDA